MEKMIGQVLNDRYILEKIIGIGGMAIVYKAVDRLTDKTVAVKVLKEEFTAEEQFRRRFLNESRAVSMLTHPNIVSVFDVNTHGRTQYIVMEYIDGITLKDYMNEKRPLPISEAMDFAEKVLCALSHAHQRGIVHRDIKPQNIMLLPDKSIKVTDFGIARVSKFETITMTEKAIGTVYYISPEQAKGTPTDEKSDIYSMGVMLYEMLTGTLPFISDTPVSVALMQVQASPRKPRELRGEIPKGLEEIVLKAMMKNPERRYHSAADMLSDVISLIEKPDIVFDYDLTEEENEDGIQENKKDSNKYPPHNTWVPILTGMLSAALIAFLLFWGLSVLIAGGKDGSKDTIKIPDLTGKSEEDIQAMGDLLTDFNVIYKYEFSDVQPKGLLIRQEPQASTSVKRNSSITLYISNGIQSVKVPSLKGVSEAQAVAMLSQNGYKYDIFYETSTSVPRGDVLRTVPAENTEISASEVIKLYISDGFDKSKVQVPDVSGLTAAEARYILQKAGLTPVENTSSAEYTDLVPAGCVISQSPAAKTEVSPGTTITLIISLGEEREPVITDPSEQDVSFADQSSETSRYDSSSQSSSHSNHSSRGTSSKPSSQP